MTLAECDKLYGKIQKWLEKAKSRELLGARWRLAIFRTRQNAHCHDHEAVGRLPRDGRVDAAVEAIVAIHDKMAADRIVPSRMNRHGRSPSSDGEMTDRIWGVCSAAGRKFITGIRKSLAEEYFGILQDEITGLLQLEAGLEQLRSWCTAHAQLLKLAADHPRTKVLSPAVVELLRALYVRTDSAVDKGHTSPAWCRRQLGRTRALAETSYDLVEAGLRACGPEHITAAARGLMANSLR
ncbi:MAG TPA: hypothetical protein VG897_13025, partial [Terriglobales bacterium]|nr:hypothetical protein [Terriglobales bacterium]